MAAPAGAQDSAQDAAAADATRLTTIEVEGKTAAGAVSDTPLATQTTADDIAKKEITSIDDLGNTTEPGVDFAEREGTVVIRGLTGPRVTTMIDGIPIPYLENFARAGGPTGSVTNSDGGGDSFDFSSLSALDVLRGADSSRAGSGALAGALVLRTLEPSDLIEPGRDWGGLAKATYDSKDRSVGGAIAFARRFERTSVLFQGSYKRGHETDSKGTVGGYGPDRSAPDPLDFDQSNLLFKLRHEVEGGHTIGFTAERYDYQSTADLMTQQNRLGGSSWYQIGDYWGHDDTRRERVSLDYDFVSPEAGGFIDAATLTAYWQRLRKNAGARGTRVGTVDGAWLRDNEMEESAYGITGRTSSTFEAGGLIHNVRIGGDLSFFQAGQFIHADDKCIRGIGLTPGEIFGSCPALHANQADMPDVDGTRLGLYIEDRISSANGRWALTPGLRFDWHDYRPQETDAFNDNSGFDDFGMPDGHSGTRLSPKLLATYDVTPTMQLFAQWSMAYRAPTVNELYLNFTNPLHGYTNIGNPDLKSETGHGFEVGADLGTADFGGRVTLFHNRYRNFIDMRTDYPAEWPGGLSTYYNIDRVEISGIELKAHKRFDNGINLHGALAYAYGKDVDTGAYLRSVAPFKAIAGIGYERENWGVDLTAIFVGKVREDGPQPGTGGSTYETFDAPGYGIVNLSGWWEPEQIKGMRIQAGVYNLFDKTYYDALSTRDINEGASPQPLAYYSEPGRTFKVSLTHRF
jgi:hemoglobin/transferrin/lactoferrin receptor protein